MAFKLKKTSENLFHKVSESKLDGGKVTQQPDVNMEAPSATPLKLDPIGAASGLVNAYKIGKSIVGAGRKIYSDYNSGKKAREAKETQKPVPKPTGADKMQAIAPDAPSVKAKPKVDKYANAAKKDSKLGEYVAKRKTLKKGSAEWNANQNKINKAYGVKKRYNEAPEAKTVNKPQAKAEVKQPVKQPKDPKSITSKNVTVKSKKQERSEKRVTKLQNKAAEDGSLSKGQRRKLARNEQKAAGEKVDYKNRSFLGKLVRKDPSKKKKKKQGQSKGKGKGLAPDLSGMS